MNEAAVSRNIEDTMLNNYRADPRLRRELVCRFDRPIIPDTQFLPIATYNQTVARRDALAESQFKLAGTNATAANVSFVAPGVQKLATAGALADQMIVDPRTAAATDVVGPWGFLDLKGSVDFDWEMVAGIDSPTAIHAGFGLQNAANPTIATPTDQLLFLYDDDDASRWQTVASVGGADTVTTTDPHGAIPAVAANQLFHFKIRVRSGKAEFFINDVSVGSSPALGTTAMLPVAWVEAEAAAAKSILLAHLRINRPY